jgi:hypothetical protein
MVIFEGHEVHIGWLNSHFILVTIISPSGEVECKRINPSSLGFVPSGSQIRKREFFLINQKLNKLPPRSSKAWNEETKGS